MPPTTGPITKAPARISPTAKALVLGTVDSEHSAVPEKTVTLTRRRSDTAKTSAQNGFRREEDATASFAPVMAEHTLAAKTAAAVTAATESLIPTTAPPTPQPAPIQPPISAARRTAQREPKRETVFLGSAKAVGYERLRPN